MAPSTEFLNSLIPVFAPLGTITWRKMFGGAGVYCDGFMFALIADEAIYLKADDQNQDWYVERGSEPFIFDDGPKPMAMRYWLAPSTILTDAATALEWGQVGLGAAKRKPVTTKKARLKQGER